MVRQYLRVFRVILPLVGLLMILNYTSVFAGDGTYNPGSPDKIDLSVVFEFEVTDFDPNPPWEGALTRASELLYNSTDGQVQLGIVNFYNNCPAKYDEADILIRSGTGGALANRGGLGTSGTHMFFYNDTHTQNVPSVRGQFGIVHEIGHYAFALYEDYKDSNGNPTSCISPTSTTASIMDGGTTIQPNNQRTEWALSVDQAACIDTEQVQETGLVDWPWITQYVQDEYGATVTEPITYTTTMPNGHQALTFDYHDCRVRSVVTIDRSGSMSGTPLSLAKLAASLYITLNSSDDELGVASFATNATTNFPISEMTLPNKVTAISAVNGLSAGGVTNIGGGLSTSLDMIVNEGFPVSDEAILLLSDGMHNTGTNPLDVIPDLVNRGVVVYALGLGTNADATLLSNIATQTGGRYFFAPSAFSLPSIFFTIFTQINNDGFLGIFNEQITPNSTETQIIYVDNYTEFGGEATFVLSWDTGDLNMVLRRPNGTVVNPTAPDVQLYSEETLSLLYRMSDPAEGNWTVEISSNSSSTASYMLQASSISKSNVSVVSTTEHSLAIANMPLPLQLSIMAPPSGGTQAEPMTGVTVSGTVKLDGIPHSTVMLYDDGNEAHNDGQAGDGIYSNVYVPTSEGSYEFTFLVINETGRTSFWEPIENPNWVPEPVDPFVRYEQLTIFAQEPTSVNLTSISGFLSESGSGIIIVIACLLLILVILLLPRYKQRIWRSYN